MLPNYTEFAEIIPGDAQDLVLPDSLGSFAGWSTAISDDGLTIVLGGPRHNGAAPTLTGPGVAAGNIWVYVWDGSTYVVEAELFPSDADGGFTLFGWTLSLSADGNTLIAAGVIDGGNGVSAHGCGTAWIFTRAAGEWTETIRLDRPSDDSERFGYAVAMSRDGTRACVGDPYVGYDKIAPPQAGEFLLGWGEAYVYDLDGGVWGITAVIRLEVGDGDDQSPPNFGAAVAFAGDNNDVLIIGGPNNGEDQVGSTWIYTLAFGVWEQTAGLIPGGTYQFGRGIAATTNRLVITGRRQSGISIDSVLVYSSSDGGYTWSYDVSLNVAVDDPQDSNTWAPALSADGNTLLIGPGFLFEEYEDGVYGDVAVLGYTVADGWNQTQILRPDGAGADAAVGWSVAITADGRRFVAGAPGYSTDRGAAWVYRNRAVAVSFDRPHFPRT